MFFRVCRRFIIINPLLMLESLMRNEQLLLSAVTCGSFDHSTQNRSISMYLVSFVPRDDKTFFCFRKSIYYLGFRFENNPGVFVRESLRFYY